MAEPSTSPHRSARALWTPLAIALALSLAGCSAAGRAGPDAAASVAGSAPAVAEPAPEVLLDDGPEVLLILPFNVAAVMPPELEGLSPIVWKELERYLTSPRAKLKTVSFEASRKLWLSSIRQVRAGEQAKRAGYEDAARVLVEKLSGYADFDLVVAPSLFVRKASLRDRKARWDGVVRFVDFEMRGFGARRLAAEVPLEGELPAASFHAVVFDAQGRKLQEGLGGLEVLVRVRVVPDPDSETGQVIQGGSALGDEFQYVTRTDLFSDREQLREGIAWALAPLLPRRPVGAAP